MNRREQAIDPSLLSAARRHRFALCATALAVSIAAGTSALFMARKFYAQTRVAVVFPVQNRHAVVDPAFPPKTARRIVVFGDSRVVRWKNFPVPAGAELVMRGVSGETTAQMRMRFGADVLGLDPDVVVLQLGINDLVAIGALPARRDQIVRQCEANIHYFLDSLRQRKVRTILLTVIPADQPPLWRRPFWSDAIGSEVEALNRRLLSMPDAPTLKVVDARAILQDGEGRWHEGMTTDTLHLAARGYERLNAAIRLLLVE